MHPPPRLFAYPFTRLLTLMRWLALLGVLLGAASPALATKTYSDNGDGTVTDPTTGLMWMRCSMGQTWDGTTCTGWVSNYTWAQANALTGTVTFAGHSDWRLPNIRELQTIVDRSVVNPAIDSAAFPNALSSYFWSASSHAAFSTDAWHVYFTIGSTSNSDKSWNLHVRLVRGEQSSGLLDITRPNSDYVDQGDGTVVHAPTGLMWQRCAVGQSWLAGTCSFTPSYFTWDAAKLLTSNFAGQTDWRLPTEEELVSLVDYSKSSPAINATLFPNMTELSFWSASASASDWSNAWAVSFYFGSADYGGYFGKSSALTVRLVRAGKSFGPLVLTVGRTGGGQVVGSIIPGIECGAVCTSGYNLGDVVTLNAIPAANLIAWGGACSGSAPTCIVTMDTAKTVTATFMDAPIVSGLPTSLSFAAQNVGSTSAAQHVTLTNTGTAALQVSNIAATGDYSVTHNCLPGPVAAGASCTLNISFTPSASGSRTGSVTVSSNAPGSAPSIALSGTGVGGVLSLSTSTLSFSGQNTGTTSAAQSVTLSNVGGATIHNLSSVANGDFARSSTCGATLAQGTSCSISVTFSPQTAGSHVSSLVISSDAANNPHTVSLSGTGIAVPGVALSPGALNFAAQRQGTSSSPQTVTLTNTGTAKLTLTNVFSSNADFALTHNCGTGPEAGAACTVNVTFTPSANGNRTGTLSVTSDASGSAPVVSLVGIGTSALAPLCTLSATPPKVRKGGTSTLTASCDPLADSYVWAGGNCAAITTNTCIETVSATTAYSVTGTNSFGSDTATATVKVIAVDLTPILMLLLD